MGIFRRKRKGKDGKVVRDRHYTIKYKNELGKWDTAPGFTDKQASQAECQRLTTLAERKRAGLPVVEAGDRLRTWEASTAAFYDELVSRGSDPAGSHVRDARSILRRVGAGCKWTTLADVRIDTLSTYLAGLAAAKKSPQTRKHHLALTQNFLNWCVQMTWLAENPAAALEAPRIGKKGKRRLRRAFTRGELVRLLDVTREPRRSLYAIAALTGFRRKELGLLEGQDFTLGAAPSWHPRASVTKNELLEAIPMSLEVVPFLPPLGANQRLLDGLGMRRVPHCDSLRRDMRRAGIPPVDERGRHADFHALRYTFCRLLSEKLPIQFVKVMMRHATLALTADLYGQLGIKDVGAKLWQLPPLLGGDDQRGEDTARPRQPVSQEDQSDADDSEAA
jgi:integrase